jgi:hypothetical protein
VITLYQGSGAAGFELKERALSEEEWTKLKGVTVKLLAKRGHDRAAELL